MKTGRYQTWGQFLRSRRELHFRSAREFCTKLSVGISYPQYSRYESGEQLPNMEQALELFRLLEVPVLEGLLEWNRAQISDLTIRGQVEGLLQQVKSGPTQLGSLSLQASAQTSAASPANPMPLDDVIVFNRSHLRVFSSDPAYRDIFCYINSFDPEPIAIDEMAIALSLAPAKVEEMARNLHDLGVINLDEGKCRVVKTNFYFPDDAEFFPLRNLNLVHNARDLMGKISLEAISQRQAYRNLVTRELTSTQVEWVVDKLHDMVKDLVNLPVDPKAERIYSLCLLFGDRFQRPKAAPLAGLRRAKPAVLSTAPSKTLS